MPRIESDWVPFRDEVGPLGAAAPAHQLMSHTGNAAWVMRLPVSPVILTPY